MEEMAIQKADNKMYKEDVVAFSTLGLDISQNLDELDAFDKAWYNLYRERRADYFDDYVDVAREELGLTEMEEDVPTGGVGGRLNLEYEMGDGG